MEEREEKPRRKDKTNLQLKHIPDTIDADEHEIPSAIVVFKEKLNKNVETTGTDKHL